MLENPTTPNPKNDIPDTSYFVFHFKPIDAFQDAKAFFP